MLFKREIRDEGEEPGKGGRLTLKNSIGLIYHGAPNARTRYYDGRKNEMHFTARSFLLLLSLERICYREGLIRFVFNANGR